jgi:hypothetical protein
VPFRLLISVPEAANSAYKATRKTITANRAESTGNPLHAYALHVIRHAKKIQLYGNRPYQSEYVEIPFDIMDNCHLSLNGNQIIKGGTESVLYSNLVILKRELPEIISEIKKWS